MDFMLANIIFVMTGGALGSVARYAMSLMIMSTIGQTNFPWPIFCVNVLGCALIGALAGSMPKAPLYLLLGTGFIGGFTTFSTFSLESFTLIQTGRTGTALLYMLGSNLAGLLAVFACYSLAESLRKAAS